ncbi:NAD(P)-dependent alcohol dehydrogenase [Dyella nitratireducens]|uniref:Alcohol dehydrogenase n=1 Tax=Dyella nitratireducens TaxID=1849580 RepID=A0ABQ1FKU5_9GAMM|nr:NAD(P)-dependent alcohol dehydrogenase [Dyella nitratireducens]GGA17280.1 alcohol dehydrogenase [Dyella nitratireducens]GLQ44811.1 alcohol dehydrogenase [Dyella nitratireducens]
MALNIRGYAAQSATTPMAPHQFERRDPRADDVVIDILYCGVCHSDLHQARNEWGNSLYPLVPGHEIVGRVASVGAQVTGFKPGDLVGVGCMVDSCQHCAACEQGLEQYCKEMPTFTYNSRDRRDGMMTYGGYSERIVVNDKFVLRIPDGVDPKAAAPLLCAGITTWSPLRHWKIGKDHKVAIIGLGGLGHMGLKFAKALGADVTLFTRSPGKEAEARRLGADHVVLSTDEKQMAAVAGHFDFILDTVPHQHDLNPYLATLKIDGVHVLVGLVEPVNPPVHAGSLIFGRHSLAGSLIGGIPETQEMLDFCAKHGIGADVEMIDIQDINTAYGRMLNSDVRYRFVIDMASLKKA